MKIDVLTFDAASGHKSAAEAIQRQLKHQMPNASVRVVDLEDVLRCQTKLLHWIYRAGIEYFNWCMRKERYFLFPTSIRAWIRFAKINTSVPALRFLLKWTSRFWDGQPPDAIISVTPMLHTIVYEAARITNPDVRCITIPVDFSYVTPGYWFQPHVQQEYLLGSQQLVLDAKGERINEASVQRLSGMMIDPRFYDSRPLNRSTFLQELGMDPELPVGVISFGSQGTVNVLRCADRIAKSKLPVNLICLTGRNKQLKAMVDSLKSPFPIAALPFRPEPPVTALRIADFLIGKPGTMTLTEALITETPFIFLKSHGLQCAQQCNEEWVLKNNVGMQADNPEQVDSAVEMVLQNKLMLQRIRAARHDGIYDAADRILKLLKTREILPLNVAS